jgi:hypothetical protein
MRRTSYGFPRCTHNKPRVRWTLPTSLLQPRHLVRYYSLQDGEMAHSTTRLSMKRSSSASAWARLSCLVVALLALPEVAAHGRIISHKVRTVSPCVSTCTCRHSRPAVLTLSLPPSSWQTSPVPHQPKPAELPSITTGTARSPATTSTDPSDQVYFGRRTDRQVQVCLRRASS